MPARLRLLAILQERSPDVPYAIDAGASSQQPAAHVASAGAPSVQPSASAAASSFAPISAERAPDRAVDVVVDGAHIQAPPDRGFALILKGDLDGDGRVDALTWVEPASEGGGDLLWFARNGSKFSPAVRVASAPTIELSAGCRAVPELTQVGPHTAVIASKADCPPNPGSQPQVRWMAVIMPSRQPARRLEVAIEMPPRGELIEVQTDATDRDGDQFDDVQLTVTLSGDSAAVCSQ